jgi:hypothetical protein
LVVRFSGEQRVTTPAATTVETPGTFIKVAGTYAAEDLVGFDAPQSGRLRYTEAETRKHRVSLAAALTASTSAAVRLGISKGGLAPTRWVEVQAGTTPVCATVEELVDLATNNYLEAWVTADTAVTVTAQSLSLIAIA